MRTSGLLFVLVLAGCNSGPKLGVVTGTVTVDGKAVTSGTIMFTPDEGKAAVGSIGPDGRYTLTTFVSDDGALVGSHKVSIHVTSVGPSSMAPASIDEEVAQALGKDARVLVPGKITWIVPERFSRLETTTLTATVIAGTQTIDFDVSAK